MRTRLVALVAFVLGALGASTATAFIPREDPSAPVDRGSVRGHLFGLDPISGPALRAGPFSSGAGLFARNVDLEWAMVHGGGCGPLWGTKHTNPYASFGGDPVNFGDPMGLAVGDSWDPRTPDWAYFFRGIGRDIKGIGKGIANVWVGSQNAASEFSRDGIVDPGYHQWRQQQRALCTSCAPSLDLRDLPPVFEPTSPRERRVMQATEIVGGTALTVGTMRGASVTLRAQGKAAIETQIAAGETNAFSGPAPVTYDRGSLVRGDYGRNRRTVVERDPTCQYCQDRSSTTADHVISSYDADSVVGAGMMTREQAVQALNELSNLVGACRSCNSSKGARLPGNLPGTWRPANPSPRAVEIMRQLGTWVEQ